MIALSSGDGEYLRTYASNVGMQSISHSVGDGASGNSWRARRKDSASKHGIDDIEAARPCQCHQRAYAFEISRS